MPSNFTLTSALTSVEMGGVAVVNLPNTGTVSGGYTATVIMLPTCTGLTLNPTGGQTINGAAGAFVVTKPRNVTNRTVTLTVSSGNWSMTAVDDAPTDLGSASSGANSNITSLSGLTTPLSVGQGGTGSATASAARTALSVAKSGANTDITSLAGLTTPLSVGQGGTGAANLDGLATSGANSNITSLAGLTTALSAAQGGTGTTLFTSGTATFLTSGSVDVVDSSITSSSIVIVTAKGTTSLGEEFSYSLTPTTKFTLHSTNSSSTAVVGWIRIG